MITVKDKINIWLRLLTVAPGKALMIQYRRLTRESWLKKGRIEGEIAGVKFNFDFSISEMIKHMYTGSYEVDTYLALKKYLKKGDTFIDVGANIGYISTLGLGIVKEQGEVHAFEPIKRYFSLLQKIADQNKGHQFHINNAAISTEERTAEIAVNSSDNIGNNSMIMDSIENKEVETIQTINLTNYLNLKNLSPSLIKIDTEGYELQVLDSLAEFLIKSEKKPVILCEVTPDLYKMQGKSVQDLQKFLDQVGYEAYYIQNFSQKITVSGVNERVDLIFRATA
jgi:FkbM family methyltransferase